MIRLLVLLAWATVVLFAGGLFVKDGASQPLVGGLEMLAIAAGIAVIVATPLWRRSISRSREQAGTRY
jgi:hypothetical protein